MTMNELPKHISYSSFTTWQECGWKYYIQKVEGVKEAHAVWFTGGSAVHKATEVYDLEGGSSESIWNKVWFEQVKEDEEINGDMSTWQYAKREDMSWWYGEGIWMLDRWIAFRQNGWNVYEDFVEKEYEIQIEDATVKMAIDRVMTDFEGNRVLLDIKTGASSQRHPLQLAVYAWALEKQGITVDKAGFWDARTGHISLWNLSNLHSERIEDMLNTFDKARKETIFLPNLSNCGRCGVTSFCKYVNSNA
jgi:putative RecB family exonuclease